MAEPSYRARWQSLVETAALVLLACSVAWAVIAKPAPGTGAVRTAGPARPPEPPLPTTPISLAGAHVLGQKTAKVALDMYSDFQCPYCGRFARETLPALEEQYVRPGKVLLVFRNYPLPMHPFAEKAAEAAECAGDQGQFWPFHDALFANQAALDVPSLQQRAGDLHLDLQAFAACLQGSAASRVQADKSGGGALGVSATPTFLVGTLLGDETMKAMRRLSGAQPLAEFQALLDALVTAAARQGSAAAGQR
jgi:protein-disulfide isomerase